MDRSVETIVLVIDLFLFLFNFLLRFFLHKQQQHSAVSAVSAMSAVSDVTGSFQGGGGGVLSFTFLSV